MPTTSPALSRGLCLVLVLCALPQGGRAQDAADRRAQLAAAIASWANEFEAGGLGLRGVVRKQRGLAPAYVRMAFAAGYLEDRHYLSLTHLDALRKLLYHAEEQPDGALARAVLPVAAAGFERSVFDYDLLQLRDLGHWTLMRMEGEGVWFEILRAGGEPPEGEAAAVSVAEQVAALKLLGMKNKAVFRATVEGQLAAVDSRVRLAAAEAVGHMRRPETVPVLVRAMSSERHPVVAQALVKTLLRLLKSAGDKVSARDGERAVRAGLRMLGRCGWRTDMELVRLAEEFPCKEAIPVLIGVLRQTNEEPDKLLQAINEQASPLLRERSWLALRALTGAIIPRDQPEEWREFWEAEQDKIVVPDRLTRKNAGGSTRATFFGIPVTGREIAFVIDTSGSMEEAAGTMTVASGGRRKGKRGIPSRLDAAKEQLLQAVQAMDRKSRYHLFTFSSETLSWNHKPVPPNANTFRSLTEVMGKFHPGGGTNIYEALAQALDLDQLRWGQENQNTVDEIFLLSDGEPTTGAVQDPEAILRLMREANKYQKVRINTVFTGKGKGAEFLRMLAEQNDGVFVQR